MPTKPKRLEITEAERNELLAGLAEVQRRFRSDAPTNGDHLTKQVRQQLRLSPQDLRDLVVMRSYLSLCAGRTVTLTLATRLGFRLLAEMCVEATTNEATKGRLRADLSALRVVRRKPSATDAPYGDQ